MPGLRGKALIAYLLVCTVWGSTYLAIRIGVAHLPPFLFAGVRFLVAGLLLGAIVTLAGVRLPTRGRDWRTLAITGVFLLVGANAILVWSEQFIASGVASVFVAAYEVGFRDSRTGDPPDDYAVRWAIGETLNLCGALGLLSVGSSWRDRSYGLNQVGNATALEALRARSERSVLNNSNLAHGVPCLRDPAWHPR